MEKIKRICKTCGKEYEIEPGFKANWKKLLKWNKSDLWWLVFIILLFVAAQMYKKDVAACKEMMKNPCAYCRAQPLYQEPLSQISNVSNLIPHLNFTLSS